MADNYYITLGIADVLKNDVLIGTRKAINLVENANVTWNVTDDTDRVNIEAVVDSSASPAVPPTTINAADLPSEIITTLPINANIDFVYVFAAGLVGTATGIIIGIETDQPDFVYIDFSEEITNGVFKLDGPSLPTTAANRKIVISAEGGTFTAGTLFIKAPNF